MNLKINLFLWCVCNIFQQINSNVQVPHILTDCISVYQIIKATHILCTNKDNATLWQHVIDCHADITEKFLRESGEANCAVHKPVESPVDTKFSIQEVFFNICGLVHGNIIDLLMGASCLHFGKENVMNHYHEVDVVKETFGAKVPCRIGECVLGMGLDI